MMKTRTSRVFNFGAGPAMLPLPILEVAQKELLNWQNTGVSILELGHRSHEFVNLLSLAEEKLRGLITIPNNYHILFLGGAARSQFAMIPMNLLGPQDEAGYLVTGIWSQMALNEAKLLKKAYCINSDGSIPLSANIPIKNNSAYVYFTLNETINGIRLPNVPQTHGIPLIADMTSCLLSEPIDINQYALIFAGAQKNIANAGLTVVIIRDDLLNHVRESIPSMFNYKLQVEHHSLYATPPVFNCYLALKMFDWIKEQGGVEALYQQNCKKAERLYQYIDDSDFYETTVDESLRSIMNICFSIKNNQLESQFLESAQEQGLIGLKGHRLVGGLRASLYNAMPMAGVDALIDFMNDFQGSW